MGADGLRNRRCPCRSGRKYKRCCQPLHSGTPAPTAEVLMRSRFAAYALGLVDYIQHTTHPEGPHFESDRDAWTTGVRLFCQQTRFETLAILAHSEEEDRATVTFRAGLTQSGRDTSFTERSTFLRQEGCWLYLDGEAQT